MLGVEPRSDEGIVMLPKLGVAPPPTKWGGKEVGVDWLHHAVYAAGDDCCLPVARPC